MRDYGILRHWSRGFELEATATCASGPYLSHEFGNGAPCSLVPRGHKRYSPCGVMQFDACKEVRGQMSSRPSFRLPSPGYPSPGDLASVLVARLKDWRRQHSLDVKNLSADVPKAVPMTRWNEH